MTDKLDLIIFGATGFTGKNTILSVNKLSKSTAKKFTWAVAGRSEKKLQDVLAEASQKLDTDLSSIPIIIADVNNSKSLSKMTARARIIINTCGPYRFFGEPVIKACLETGTHHVDVSGEPQYMENIQLKYHKAAMEKEIYIVSACGFDSIPTDLGIASLMKSFQGTLNSVETYLKWDGKGTSGPSINYATWESAVYGFADYDELKTIRSKLFNNKMPTCLSKLPFRGKIHKSAINNDWVIPFLGSDRSVATRSQRYFYEEENKRPIQIQTYVYINSLFYLGIMTIIGAVFTFLAKYNFGQKLLLNYPGFFSFGFVSYEGPSDQNMKNSKFVVTIIGEGWSKSVPSTNGIFEIKPNITKMIDVSGENPGYGLTCNAVTISALTILQESNKMPKKGGVYTPAAAFAHTSIIDELVKTGLKIQEVY